MNNPIVLIAYYLVTALIVLIFIRSLLSWFPIGYNPVSAFLVQVTEPVLAPVRRVMPRTGMFDLTPMITMIILLIVQQALRAFL